MKFIADFHIHSHYSIATSKNLVPEHLDFWARLKGITLVGTGDFTHPGWIKELKEKLEPAEEGLFKLKPEYKDKNLETPFLPDAEVRFMLTAEISNIYKKSGKVRKVHNVIFAPDFETVEKIQQKLTNIEANITSDGRPILGLDSRDLLEMCLDCSERIFFVPAHIWTPWFSILGSKSGFDSVEECYGDLTPHIHAVETGLSTDPPMNWMCSFLDKYTLISNSDAHSPEKLGRNANRFNTELSYDAVTDALKTGDPACFRGTIDLFPQEGKYHYDGHRKCSIRWDPVQTLKHNGICSVCQKRVTVGVMNRVVLLSDRENLEERPNRAPFHSIIPLKEILSEIENVGPNSKKVASEYMSLLKKGTPELDILLNLSLEEIERTGGPQLAEAIRRMRNREIYVKEGFDGEYGVITVFQKDEAKDHSGEAQGVLFEDMAASPGKQGKRERRKMINFDLTEYRLLQKRQAEMEAIDVKKGSGKKKEDEERKEEEKKEEKIAQGLNAGQLAAVHHFTGPALVTAGPGTGKTRVLTYRIAFLVSEKNIDPRNILAITFTNKAAAEIEERLEQLLEKKARPLVTTFHALGYSILDEVRDNSGLNIIDPEDKKRLLQYSLGCEKRQVNKMADAITEVKQQLKTADEIEDDALADLFRRYQARMEELNAFDLEDLIYLPVQLFMKDPALLNLYRERYPWILVDEYQDVNFAQYLLIGLLAQKIDKSFWRSRNLFSKRFLAAGGKNLNPAKGTCNLFVIGDPDQAIYGFRGADVRFIKAFKEDFPQAVHFRLQQSYRCTDSILRASGRVIRDTAERSDEGALKGISEGVKIKIAKNSTGKSEAEFVARTIEEMMGGLRFFSMDSSITQGNEQAEIESLSDFVVLCRVRAQLEALEKAFNDHTIPYQLVGDTPFFQREPVKSVIDILKLSRNPGNGFIEEQLINRKVIAPMQLKSLLDSLGQVDSVGAAVRQVVDLCFPDFESVNGVVFRRLFQLIGPYNEVGEGGIEAFLKFTALGTAVDTYSPNLENVALMTLHAAKGLEFKCVFIVGCEDGILPYSLYEQRACDPGEERRLLYVGMTRAQKFLFLTHAEKRYLGGREYRLPRSPFLDNIEKELIELSHQKLKKLEKKEPVQRSLFE